MIDRVEFPDGVIVRDMDASRAVGVAESEFAGPFVELFDISRDSPEYPAPEQEA
ncbi:MAG: hypothetical protein RQ745_11615 [Longimicrobiales bacterium]|nr:hypothetical protein [Longimicrobiales bacterium]